MIAVKLPPNERLQRFAKFALVGASGVVINYSVMFTLISLLGFPWWVANFAAISVAMTTNFLGNEFWTWRRHGETEKGPTARQAVAPKAPYDQGGVERMGRVRQGQ